MSDMDLIGLMSELLNMDRLEYLRIIEQSEKGAKSMDIAEEILKPKGIPSPKEIRNENIKVNKRLRRLVDLEVLNSSEKGVYTISSFGYLLVDSWRELNEKVGTLNRFREFFDTHYVEDIPQEFLRQIYKLNGADVTLNPIQWMKEVTRYMRKIERKFYNVTEYIHDIPDEILEKKLEGEIEEISILYQFHKYPELNYPDEKDLFDDLVKAHAEFRYLILENRHPIGIRVVDEKWATFGLARKSDGVLDRDRTLLGTDKNFISWCRDLMYHMWHFEAEPLKTGEVIAKD
jgi:predicted transcriptional regulator